MGILGFGSRSKFWQEHGERPVHVNHLWFHWQKPLTDISKILTCEKATLGQINIPLLGWNECPLAPATEVPRYTLLVVRGASGLVMDSTTVAGS